MYLHLPPTDCFRAFEGVCCNDYNLIHIMGGAQKNQLKKLLCIVTNNIK